MDYLRQVQRGIDYIEDHLDEDIDAGEVARRAGISHWHFQRIFKALTNETLKTYIRSRRFAHALDRLATSDERVVEIALAAGFDTQASFTRAFKLAFAVTPAHYRRHHRRFPVLRKLRFDESYLRHLDQQVSLEPELYVQPPLVLIGMCTRLFGVDSEKNNLADKLPALWAAFVGRLGELDRRVPGLCYGVVRQTPALTDELEYHAVAEVAHDAPVPAGMVRLELASARYARFTHVGKATLIDHTVNYIYSSWLARSGMRHTYGADLELYGADYHPESDQSVIRYAIPIEPADAAGPANDGSPRGAQR